MNNFLYGDVGKHVRICGLYNTTLQQYGSCKTVGKPLQTGRLPTGQ